MTSKPRLTLTKNPVKVFDIDFLEAQKKFFREFIKSGFEDLFEEINPIEDYTASNWELSFEDVQWEDAKLGFGEAQRLGLSHDAPVFVTVKLVNKRTGEIKKQKLFLADMPLMSNRASFMVNGNERVVVFQIMRSEGILFAEAKNSTPAKRLYNVKLMPNRGKWYDFEINKYGVMSVKLLQKRPRILLTTLLRAFGYGSNEELVKLLGEFDKGKEDVSYLENTLKKDPTRSTEEALIEIYRKLRPEDSITLENAKNFLENMFFNKRRFYLGKIGRYKLNQKLGNNEEITPKDYLLKKRDILDVVKSLLQLNHGTINPDDIDSLGNRRIRGINEIVAEKIRVGMLIMEKNIRDRMSTYATDEKVTPAMLVNTKPVMAAINQFFGSSALLRYLDQENILSELEAKRKVTAGGPRGLTKERATFSVRDVHNSHYGRLCPVTTPEGPSVGMVNQLSVYSTINEYGFLESPYHTVITKFRVNEDKVADFKNRHLAQTITGVGKAGDEITKTVVDAAVKKKIETLLVKPFVTDEIVYMDSDTESQYKIAPFNLSKDKNGNILDEKSYVRFNKDYISSSTQEIQLIDISPAQIAGLGLALIPFASNDDPNRTFYGAKTQNQAVPLLNAQAPIIGTGFEKQAAKASGRTIYAEEDGVVLEADGRKVVVQYGTGKKSEKRRYEVEKFTRTNQNTCFTQNLLVMPGQEVKAGDVLIDGPCTDAGELSLGVNLRAAYMVWDGFNYEDGMVINERLVKDDTLTSIHIHEYNQEVRETKLGNEIVTRDIPSVGERALRHLDDEGVVRIGASVEAGDILVGIIAPKGETELTAEEKLLRAIFGEYARDVRDNSLKMPHGEEGVVVDVQVLDREKGAKLNPGVLKEVKVWVARTHKISVGDKLTGYHGEKGLISKIVAEEDMPHTADGKAIDIILGPSSMIRRMNVGQLIETHIGQLAQKLGVRVEAQPFSEFSMQPLLDLAKKEGITHEEKVTLFDGRNGEEFDQKVTVGWKYMFKLDHLADHKVHARSTGPYTLVTQQPLRGKAQMGGQRLGEMEVWALEAHAAPHLLHEMLTIKSDDVVGRAAAYKAILSGQKIQAPQVPESFNVLDKELAGLAIKLDKINAEYDFERAEMALDEIVDSVGAKKREVVATDELVN